MAEVARRRAALFAVFCLVQGCHSNTTDDADRMAPSAPPSATKPSERVVLMNGAFRSTAQLQADFIGSPMSGAAYSSVVPTKHAGVPSVVGFINGFKLEDGGATVDSPSVVMVLDAKTGQLRDERRYAGEASVFPAPRSDDAAAHRLAELQDRLAPAFFAGEPRASAVDAKSAEEYLALFPRAVGEPLVRYYRELAPDWFAWLGS